MRGVRDVFLTEPVRVNENLGVERHQKGLNPQPPTNRALMIIINISHPTICTDASIPLFFIFVNVCTPQKNTMADSKSFSSVLRVSGLHCQIICRPSQLFRLSEELSNIIYSCLLRLVPHVASVRQDSLRHERMRSCAHASVRHKQNR